MLQFLDPLFLINTLGTFGVIAIVFAESGLFFGFFFPGDSLLFTAGLLASQGLLNIYYLLPGVFLAAVLGDNVGYAFGRKVGPKIFTREDSIFFHRKHIETARRFYDKYGNKTIVLARFIPIVRTFAPIVAGVGNMDYKRFLTYNLAGGLLWTVVTLGGGYLLGATVPGIKDYILPIIIVIVLTSFLPPVFEIWRNRRSHQP